MPGIVFHVVQHQGAWSIRQGERCSPPHDSRAAALRTAVAFARWLGEDATVLVQTDDGTFTPPAPYRRATGSGPAPSAETAAAPFANRLLRLG